MPEPEMWPIGKAFACFVAGYIHKPVRKRYSYHGMRMICNKLGRMKPWECRQFNLKVGWELIHDYMFYSGNWYWHYWNNALYYPDLESEDLCYKGFRDGHKRYYFCEAHYFRPEEGSYMKIGWNNGINCRSWSESGYYNYIYKAWFDEIWNYEKTLVWFYMPEYGSRLKVWRSNTGERPEYNPVPEDLIMR